MITHNFHILDHVLCIFISVKCIFIFLGVSWYSVAVEQQIQHQQRTSYHPSQQNKQLHTHRYISYNNTQRVHSSFWFA